MLTTNVQKRLEDANRVLKSLACNVSVEVRKYMDQDNLAVDTAVIVIDEEREYAAYATQAPVAMATYLCGLQHGLQLVSGNYPFKALNTQAKVKGRESILKKRQKRKRSVGLNAKTSARFAFQRAKFTEA